MSILLHTGSVRMRVLIPLIAFFLANASNQGFASQTKGSPKSGDFGGDLELLARFYAPPAGPRESNYFIDMWSGGKLPEFAHAHGLTNNRALFVISHARGRSVAGKWRYALYPSPEQLKKGLKTPYYSPQDILRMLGTATASGIDNLIISGCNAENLLDLAEWRACFPNATNIIHAAAGKDGYDFLLRHALLYPSPEIKWLYEMPDSFSSAGLEDEKSKAKMPPKDNLYVASLFEPGASIPYLVRVAGRELLDAPVVEAPKPKVNALIQSLPVSTPQPPTTTVQPTNSHIQAKVVASRPPIIIRRPVPPKKPQVFLKPVQIPKGVLVGGALVLLGVIVVISGIVGDFRDFRLFRPVRRVTSPRVSEPETEPVPPAVPETETAELAQTNAQPELHPKG